MMKAKMLIVFLSVMGILGTAVPVSAGQNVGNAPEAPKAFDSGSTPNSDPLKLLRILPDGKDVTENRQIVFQFDRPVVPVGDMARDAAQLPIRILPTPRCQWRWLNASALACQLSYKDALKPATRYTVHMGPGLAALDGSVMTEGAIHRFVTERPTVRRAWFLEWRAPGMPQIRLTFNQPVTRASVRNHLKFVVEKAESRDFGLAATPSENDRSPVYFVPENGKPFVLAKGQRGQGPGEEARRVWVVAPETELPSDSDVRLTVEPGLVSVLGPEPGAESRTVAGFRTFPEFRFLGVACTDSGTRKSRLLKPQALDDAGSGPGAFKCLPLNPVALVFSVPVHHDEVRTHLRFSPDLAGGRTDYDPWANVYSFRTLRRPHEKGQTYRVYLPETLKAFSRYEIFSDADGVRDAFGRSLERPLATSFQTDHREPRLVLDHKRAVLEKEVDTEVPVYVTNLDRLKLPHRVVTTDGAAQAPDFEKPVPRADDISFAMPLGVRQMLAGRSGAVTGHIEPRPEIDGNDPSRYRFFAQVTPFQVHVKLGHFSSLVWITDLATGQPVEKARVVIYADDYSLQNVVGDAAEHKKGESTGLFQRIGQALHLSTRPMAGPGSPLGAAMSDKDGIARLPGIEKLDPDLGLLQYGWRNDRPRLFVRVDKGQDLALVPLDDNFMTWAGSAGSWIRPRNGHLHAWGTTAQGVYKAGDTIDYKLYVRNQSNRHWVAPPAKGYRLTVIDPKGETVTEIEDLTLSAFGAYDGNVALSDQAAVGWYRFKLDHPGLDGQTLEVLRVLVSDFTPSPFRVTAEVNGRKFGPGDELAVTALAKSHAGGPHAGAKTRTTALLQPGFFHPENPVAKDFTFEIPRRRQGEILLHESSLTGDKKGEAVARFVLKDQPVDYGRMEIEAAVRDDRGRYVAARTRAEFFGKDRFVGLKNTAWTYQEDKAAKIEYLVVDENGKPLAGVPVQIKVEREEVRASRVKGAGNAYLTRTITQWVAAASLTGVSAESARNAVFTPQEPGSYRITAGIRDSKNRLQQSRIHAWVLGKGAVVWQEPDDFSLQIIPEQASAKAGQTAQFLVKNPFPGARALITVERYGVIRHWTRVFDNATEVIRVPVTADDLPGFYLSVLVNSPRAARPPGPDGVDLGKPTFRLGYLRVPVTGDDKEIDIRITTGKKVYKPRQRVTATLEAAGLGAGEPVEFAVAVVDEAVLDLNARGRDYYDPYKGFNRFDELDLNNYSLLTRLVGRQKFEKKGADPGGDGGGQNGPRLRNRFKFVGYWTPSLKADKNGRAEFAFDLPDNLTGWRILALAVTPDDRMGLGETGIKVNQPTEIRPVMPNQVTVGDAFQGGFSVMNRTDRQRRLTVEIRGAGALAAQDANHDQEIVLGPYQHQTVWLPVKADRAGEIAFFARAADETDGDALEHHVPVHPRRSLVTSATYGTTDGERIREVAAVPKRIHPHDGGLRVAVSPTVMGNIAGAFSYIRDYPYGCWEQLLTRAVMADMFRTLKAYLPTDLSWEGSEAVPEKILQRAASFQAPGGGMAFWIPDNRYVSPYLSAYTALAFNWLRDSGREIPLEVEKKLHDYLQTLLRREIMPAFYSPDMAASVRAVAVAALAGRGLADRDDVLRLAAHLGQMDLFAMAHLLQAAAAVDRGGDMAEKITRRILGHASQTGGKFAFNETWDSGFSRMLATPLRSNCAVLSALTGYGTDDKSLALVGDIPFKQVRSITGARGSRNHWENTQENVFCMKALADYARVYEKDPPRIDIRASLGNEALGQARFHATGDKAAVFTAAMDRLGPGKEAVVALEKQGTGRFYYTVGLSYAPLDPAAERINAGMAIRREYSVEKGGGWVLLKNPMKIRRGDLVRVDIYLSLPALRHFVVVDDPVPGGLEPVNRDLATASVADSKKGRFQAAEDAFWFTQKRWSEYGPYGASFYHRELRHDRARFFADSLPAGNYHLSYTAQAVAPGAFAAMAVKAEEMYDPDVFGMGLPGILEVEME